MTTSDIPAPGSEDVLKYVHIYALTTGDAVFLPQAFFDDENAILSLNNALATDKSFAHQVIALHALSVVRIGRMSLTTGIIDQSVPTIIHTIRHLDDLAVAQESDHV